MISEVDELKEKQTEGTNIRRRSPTPRSISQNAWLPDKDSNGRVIWI